MINFIISNSGFSNYFKISINKGELEGFGCKKKWTENAVHSIARKKGRKEWYHNFKVRIARTERDYDFEIVI